MVHKYFDVFSVSLYMTKTQFQLFEGLQKNYNCNIQGQGQLKIQTHRTKVKPNWKADDLTSISIFRINVMPDVKFTKGKVITQINKFLSMKSIFRVTVKSKVKNRKTNSKRTTKWNSIIKIKDFRVKINSQKAPNQKCT